MARLMSPFRDRLRARVRALRGDQRGFALIEVMMSSVVVAIVSVGVLAGLDAAGATSGGNKSRGIAASVAQEDQERIRALPADTVLQTAPGTRTVNVGGVAYSVQTRVRPVGSSGSGCGDGSLLRLVSIVTWPAMHGIKPVRTDSYLAPKPGSFQPGEGGVIVGISDRDGNPLAGVPVTLAGPRGGSDVTDTNGCASFLYYPAGNYTVSFGMAGYVTTAGVSNVSQAVTVPDGAVASADFDYDRAASLTANVTTYPYGSAAAVADPSTSLTLAHSSLPAPGARFFASPGATTIATGTVMFPFSSDYLVYSGRCTGANPGGFTPPAPVTAITLDPGSSASVTVVEPSINATVLVSGIPVPNATVKYYDKTCGGNVSVPNATDAAGRVINPGMPYGTYDVCADNGIIRSATRTNVQNWARGGTANFNLTLTTPGRCP